VSSLILAEVGLSFFGFGVQPPDVSLGTLIGDHASAALAYPWEFYFPSGFLVALILAEVGLSFFGFGVQPPDVSLGTLIGNYAGAALTYAWEFYFPVGFLVLLVLAINLVGDGLRDALDPTAGARGPQ
jgi:ABC-type dipeptide/oligopeptide/nickel transport system permease subunit